MAAAAAALPVAVHAHVPEPPDVRDPWAWNFDAWVAGPMLLAAALYALGLARLWRHAGSGRGIRTREAACFAGGWLATAVALVSPLDSLGGSLFSAHMVQHELLMIVAAPLLVLGRPLATWAWALPPSQRRAAGRFTRSPAWSALWHVLTDPLVAWGLHALALWAWHVPAFFDAALRHEGWHVAQHASFLGTALFFWWAVLGHDARSVRGAGASFAYLFTTMMHTSALGALLSLAPTPWYGPYVETAVAFGLDPVQDQQLGGLVMWVPAGLAYVAAGLALAGRLLLRSRA